MTRKRAERKRDLRAPALPRKTTSAVLTPAQVKTGPSKPLIWVSLGLIALTAVEA